MTKEEGDLVALLKQKDYFAFNYFYDKYAPALYSVILQIVKNEEAGNKVLCNVFIIIWSLIDTYEPAKGTLFIWMLQIARRSAIDETKSIYSTQTFKQGLITGEEGSHRLAESADNIGLKKAIQHLEDEQQTLINLFYYTGCSYEQIAETLSIPAGTVKTKIRTALAELGNLLRRK